MNDTIEMSDPLDLADCDALQVNWRADYKISREVVIISTDLLTAVAYLSKPLGIAEFHWRPPTARTLSIRRTH